MITVDSCDLVGFAVSIKKDRCDIAAKGAELTLPIPLTTMDHQEIFEPYERLVKVTICGEVREVPENNSILRGLQYLDMDAISYGDFCWNGECINCKVSIRTGDKEKSVIACRTNVEDGMEIVKLSEGMEIS